MADIGQENTFGGAGLVGIVPGFAHVIHGIAQFVGHVVEGSGQVAQLAGINNIVNAIIEVAAADAAGRDSVAAAIAAVPSCPELPME